MAAHQDRVEQIAAIAQELKYALPIADVCSHVVMKAQECVFTAAKCYTAERGRVWQIVLM